MIVGIITNYLVIIFKSTIAGINRIIKFHHIILKGGMALPAPDDVSIRVTGERQGPEGYPLVKLHAGANDAGASHHHARAVQRAAPGHARRQKLSASAAIGVIQQAAMAVATGVAKYVVVYRAFNERSGRRYSTGIGEGIVTAIGSSHTYKAVLENPDRISKTVLQKGLDSGTAFEILSIDIADVDVGDNIGAKLQADQAEADLCRFQAEAEQRRAAARAREQEMSLSVIVWKRF